MNDTSPMGRGALRVLLDVSPLTLQARQRTGLARVAWDLASELAAMPGVDLRVCGWGSLQSTEEVSLLLRETPWLRPAAMRESRLVSLFWRLTATAGRPRRIDGAWRARLAQAVNLLRDRVPGAHGEDFDIVHSSYAGVPRGVRRWRRPTVITVHDLTPLRLAPSLMPPGQVAITRRILRTIRRDDWVACVSEHTRRDFLASRAHSSERTVVIPNGVDHSRFRPVQRMDELMRVRRTYGLGEGPFVLTLSSLAPHKNLRMLVELWPEIRRRWPAHQLVLAGGRGADASALMRGLGLTGPPPAGLVLTGFIPDTDLPALFSAAELFVFPSLYEGFGLPVLEAMACGSPVVAARSSSIPEVVGTGGELIEPEDQGAWMEAIESRFRAGNRTRPDPRAVAVAAGFSWKKTAGAYLDLYAQAHKAVTSANEGRGA